MWAYPPTWLMTNESGYWKSAAIPKLEEKAHAEACGAVLYPPAPKSKAGGYGQVDLTSDDCADPLSVETTTFPDRPIPKYPDGRPLRDEEIKAGRQRKPQRMGVS